MSINFPTAFWKNQSESDSSTSTPSETAINWQKYLYYGSTKEETVDLNVGEFLNPVGYATAGLSVNSTYPFNEVTSEDFFTTYYDYTTPTLEYYEKTDPQDRPYFGWYIASDGNVGGGGNVGIGSQALTRYHREDPWIVEDNGRKINLFFQADERTLHDLGWSFYYQDQGAEGAGYQYYNHFIQSGYAEGSFSLSEDADLEIKASGLGELFSNEFDLFQLYINDELICKGTAPGGGGTRPWDMDHCKFFDADGDQTPTDVQAGTRKDEGTSIQKYSIAGNTTISNVVEQTARRTYVKEASRFIGTVSLTEGDYKVKIFYNTHDGQYNSGAFYGATFNFS